MKGTTRERAVDAFAKLPLSVANEKLARYWLSLWEGDTLPRRADFSPGRVREHLPGLAIFEVRAGESVRCRLAGTMLHRAVGRELTGCDWRDYTAKDQWAERLERNTVIAQGAVGVGIRHSAMPEGLRITQELQLPFADKAEDGARLLLMHLDWRPGTSGHKAQGSVPIKIADEFHTIRLGA
jgi:hypothetical protein